MGEKNNRRWNEKTKRRRGKPEKLTRKKLVRPRRGRKRIWEKRRGILYIETKRKKKKKRGNGLHSWSRREGWADKRRNRGRICKKE